jgi:hypothetical protein
MTILRRAAGESGWNNGGFLFKNKKNKKQIMVAQHASNAG